MAMAIGVKVAFHKLSRRPRNRDINMPRALVDILRHQSSPVQQGERNNSTVLTTATSSEGTQGRTSKNFYTPVLQSKDNRSESISPTHESYRTNEKLKGHNGCSHNLYTFAGE
ncbi:protein shisa-7-like [Sinocyclocheilus grahami]|uniref:protein shisa-7-like n=1 Tax=Sinocyclocheilus grahami TaxID=75366 RepID=UPI0007AC6FC4|nr:PREDICTED: protein shisa-7-like [Sinocyclocheilus grahami]